MVSVSCKNTIVIVHSEFFILLSLSHSLFPDSTLGQSTFGCLVFLLSGVCLPPYPTLLCQVTDTWYSMKTLTLTFVNILVISFNKVIKVNTTQMHQSLPSIFQIPFHPTHLAGIRTEFFCVILPNLFLSTLKLQWLLVKLPCKFSAYIWNEKSYLFA